MDNTILELIKLTNQFVQKTDEINKRLVIALIVITITLSATLTCIVGFYFFSSYEYGEVTQTQEVSQSVKQEVDQNVKE